MEIALASVAMVLNPEAFVLGGGFAHRLGDRYLDRVDEAFRSRAMAGVTRGVRLFMGALGDDAVPLGAALLAREAASA